MQFEKGFIYHIYNQGNNRQKIFYNRENYLYFLKKIGLYIQPFGDVLAWCLMPNHFHLMVLVNRTEIDQMTLSHQINNRNITQSIAIMLRSYTRAINKQEDRSGSLFRPKTKAICLNCPSGITPTYFETSEGTQIYQDIPEMQYPQVCLNYIHQNPVKAGLVKNPEDWEFSSFRDYEGLRNGKLVNKEIAAKYVIL